MSAGFPGVVKILFMSPKEESKAREEPRIDREAVSVVTLGVEDDDREYWHSRTPHERLRHLEFLRRVNYGYQPTERIQRVLEVAQF